MGLLGLYLAIISIPQLTALELTRSVEVPCPNETVRYECTAFDVPIMEWRVTVPTYPHREEIIRRSYSLNSVQTLSWPHFSVKLIFTMRTDKPHSITSVAEFVATPELLGTEFVCSASSFEERVVLYSIAGELTYIHTMNFRLYRNSSESVLELTWNEPVRNDLVNVIDFYNVTVNSVAINTDIPQASVILPPNETNIIVTLSAGNCLGPTPTTSFNLLFIKEIDEGHTTSAVYTEQETTSAEVTTTRNLSISDTECDDVTISTFVAAVVGACIGSLITSIVCCLISILIFKWRSYKQDINRNMTQISQPVYEEIYRPNEKMNMHNNDAYSQ